MIVSTDNGGMPWTIKVSELKFWVKHSNIKMTYAVRVSVIKTGSWKYITLVLYSNFSA